MIGLDTNVLLRILIDDGSSHVATARRFASEQVQNGESLYVEHVVLAEIEWVLGSTFKYGREQIGAAIDMVLGNSAYEVADREVALAAWTKYRDGHADFADCLIAAKHAAAGCAFTATFDRAMRTLPTTRVLG